jgi:hypothetical protein
MRSPALVALELTILALECGRSSRVTAGRTGPLTGVLLGPQEPSMQRLLGAGQPRRDRRHGGPLGRMVRQLLTDQSEGPSRTSGLHRCARDCAMAPRSHKVEPHVIPGRFTASVPLRGHLNSRSVRARAAASSSGRAKGSGRGPIARGWCVGVT